MRWSCLLRAVSASPVGGVLLEEHPDDAAMGETDLERYRPLINVAQIGRAHV